MTRLLLATGGVSSSGNPTPPEDLSPWGTAWLAQYEAGGGTTIQSLIAAAATANGGVVHPDRARRIVLAAGTYEERVVPSTSYLSIVGPTEDPADATIHWTNAADSGLIRQYPFEVSRSVHVKNLTIWGEHESYAMHADGNSTPTVPQQFIFENVHFKNDFGHFALGLGPASWQEFYFYNCRVETSNGTLAPLFGHNSTAQAHPSLIVVNDCDLIGENEGVLWSDINSDQPDLFVLSGGSITVPNADFRAQLGSGVASSAESTIDYRIDAAFSIDGSDVASISRTMPAPIPHWTDATSAHNVYFGI